MVLNSHFLTTSSVPYFLLSHERLYVTRLGTITMSQKSYILPCSYLPSLDGLITTGGVDDVAAGWECDWWDVVVVAVHCFHTFERLVKIPELDRHVRAARYWKIIDKKLHNVREILQKEIVIKDIVIAI